MKIDIADPFLTYFQDNPDYNKSDSLNETRALGIRQKLVYDFLDGDIQADTLLDCLEEQGEDAASYVNHVSAVVGMISDSGVVYLENESGIYLPQGFAV